MVRLPPQTPRSPLTPHWPWQLDEHSGQQLVPAQLSRMSSGEAVSALVDLHEHSHAHTRGREQKQSPPASLDLSMLSSTPRSAATTPVPRTPTTTPVAHSTAPTPRRSASTSTTAAPPVAMPGDVISAAAAALASRPDCDVDEPFTKKPRLTVSMIDH